MKNIKRITYLFPIIASSMIHSIITDTPLTPITQSPVNKVSLQNHLQTSDSLQHKNTAEHSTTDLSSEIPSIHTDMLSTASSNSNRAILLTQEELDKIKKRNNEQYLEGQAQEKQKFHRIIAQRIRKKIISEHNHKDTSILASQVTEDMKSIEN